MLSEPQASSIKRYFPLVVICTSAVTVVPIALVTFLERSGLVHSLPLSVVIGALVSATIATIGSRVWMAWFGAADVVFADLLLWGWLRKIHNERQVARSVEKLGLREDATSGTAPLDRRRRLDIFKDLAQALESRDPYTLGHNRRVERHSYMIAKAMGLPDALTEKIRVAASVHDVGKLDIPLAVLRKPSKLTDEEFDLIKQHSAKGAEMVAALGDPEITAMVRHHHERLDGSGYPDGLAGDDIPVGARIIATADTFDAIVSSRSYRGAEKHKQAIEIMKNEAGVRLDSDAVTAFLNYYSGRSSFEWWASMSTLPQRALRFLGADGAGATAVAQGAGAVTTAVVLTSAAVVPWAQDFRADLASWGGTEAEVTQQLAAGPDLGVLAGALGAAEGGGPGEGRSYPGTQDLWRLVDRSDIVGFHPVAFHPIAGEAAGSVGDGSTNPVRRDDTGKAVGGNGDAKVNPGVGPGDCGPPGKARGPADQGLCGPPGQDNDREPPGKAKEPPGKAKEPPGKAKEPPGKAKEPPGQGGGPPGKAKEPPGKATDPPGNPGGGSSGNPGGGSSGNPGGGSSGNPGGGSSGNPGGGSSGNPGGGSSGNPGGGSSGNGGGRPAKAQEGQGEKAKPPTENAKPPVKTSDGRHTE